MKNKKIIAILMGMVLAFGICISGCSNGTVDLEQSDELQIQGETLKSFEAKTLDGNTFTQDDLAKKDVTVMNFWSTMCGPCVEEMPDIARFAKSLPENVEMLTVCLDGGEDTDLVKQLLDEAGYEGITLLSGTGDFRDISDKMMCVPTTILADREGNIIGEALIGGQENLEKVYTEMVNNALKAMGKAEITDGKN